MTFAIHPGPIDGALAAALRALDSTRFADALWQRRLDVWSADAAVQEKIGRRLGWLDAIEFVTPALPRLRHFGRAVADDGFTDVVLLGMGGSSLAPEVMRGAIGAAVGQPAFCVLDSINPDAVRRALARVRTSLFILASKSGTTIEPNAMAAEADRALRAAGVAQPGAHFVAITDEDTALHRRAQTERFRDIFVNPSDIGGRYSALSFFGLVPAALMGIDLDALLAPARRMAEACRHPDPRTNPGLALGAFMAAGALAGRDKLTLRLPPALERFGWWVEQLVAESTGKEAKGIVPVAGEAGEPSDASDRIVVRMRLERDDVPSRGPDAGPTPTMDIRVPDAMALGAEFFRWEVATATAGMLLKINPFDEPNVQQAKDATATLLQAVVANGRLPGSDPDGVIEEARITLTAAAREGAGGGLAFLRAIAPPDYFAILAYAPPADAEFGRTLLALRHAVGRETGCATMLGYGPRYLHSTGQLHKGGPNTGVFLIVTSDSDPDLAIPGHPYSFGILEQAQARGDFDSLTRAGRRAAHVHLPRRDPALLDRVVTALR